MCPGGQCWSQILALPFALLQPEARVVTSLTSVSSSAKWGQQLLSDRLSQDCPYCRQEAIPHQSLPSFLKTCCLETVICHSWQASQQIAYERACVIYKVWIRWSLSDLWKVTLESFQGIMEQLHRCHYLPICSC